MSDFSGYMGQIAGRRTASRRAFLALALGTSASLLGGCGAARAQASGAASQPTGATAQAGASGAASQAGATGGAIVGPRARPATTPAVRGAPSGQAVNRSVQTLRVGEVERRYIRYEPGGLDPSAPAPLLVALHGRGGNGRVSELMFRFNELADQHRFVVAYPDALGNPPTWNEGFVGLPGGPYRPDDIGFIRALVDREGRARFLDARRLFVCGHSSGALMTYRLAAEAADLFAAAGAVAGSAGYTRPSGQTQTVQQPSRPISIVHVHGTADPLVPYNGGDGNANRNGDFISVADTISFWVKANRCTPTPTTETTGPVRRDTYGGGADGAEVTLWTLDGGGHEWPRTTAAVRRNIPTSSMSASEEIWAFFAAHGRTA
ncbi:MAG: hypothetical protein IT306_17640 [Chloroflexi bacterium]|nr:hypothetical protein [Chloroflexota bacterium]